MNSGLYPALIRLAEKRGIVVAEVPFKPENKEYRGFYENNRRSGEKLIFINRDISQENKTFTLAHELGHYVLHGKEMGTAIWKKKYWKFGQYHCKKEDEANRFARKLLALLEKRASAGSEQHESQSIGSLVTEKHVQDGVKQMRSLLLGVEYGVSEGIEPQRAGLVAVALQVALHFLDKKEETKPQLQLVKG